MSYLLGSTKFLFKAMKNHSFFVSFMTLLL
nr:MAG TPA: hypothetical protein [Caudoviricetes sp.]